ncbi:MAG: hypothetical protein ACR2LO_01820 [Ilumatobacteraceae bacterium]
MRFARYSLGWTAPWSTPSAPSVSASNSANAPEPNDDTAATDRKRARHHQPRTTEPTTITAITAAATSPQPNRQSQPSAELRPTSGAAPRKTSGDSRW